MNSRLRLSGLLSPTTRTPTTEKSKPEVIPPEGFTLIELLVVIMILGLLAGIAMPNLIQQVAKAKQTESKQSLSLVNRAQSQYRAEYNTFASSFEQLALGMGLTSGTVSTTGNYTYTIDLLTNPQSTATITARPMDNAVHSYTAGNLRYANNGQSTIASLICESQTPGSALLATVSFNSTSIVCPTGYKVLDDTAAGN